MKGNIERKYLNDGLANNIGTEGKDYTLSETEPFIVTYLNSGRSYLIDENGEVSEYIDIAKYVEIGQYVAYNPTISDKNGTQVDPNKLTYTSPIGSATEHGNGKSVQKFTATANTKWKILDIGRETVTLISAEPIKKDEVSQDNGNFAMSGAIGYLYAEQELNEICKIFGYGYGADTSQVTKYSYGGPIDGELTGKITDSGARSITIEDMNKKAGITEADYTTLNSSYGDTTNPTLNVYYPTINGDSATGKSTSPGVQKLKNTYYDYNKSKIENTSVQNLLFNGNYWFASRCSVTASDFANFHMRIVDKDSATRHCMCGCDKTALYEQAYSDYAVRPIVTLKSDVINIEEGYNEATGGWSLK